MGEPEHEIPDESIVLIDTWWNVNAEQTAETKEQEQCFNRYMVECE